MTEEDEATVKRFYKEKKIVIDYNLKIVQWSQFTLDNVAVIGKVIGLYHEM